jgi:hypothetical protein
VVWHAPLTPAITHARLSDAQPRHLRSARSGLALPHPAQAAALPHKLHTLCRTHPQGHGRGGAGPHVHAAPCCSQMICFVLAVSVLGQAVENGGVLALIGEAAKLEFGGALTLIHDSTEDELVCSGKIRASDVVIQGTNTTVAQMMAEHAMMKDDIAALKQFVGMSSPPPPPSTFSIVPSCGACMGTSGGRLPFCHSTVTMSQMQCEEACRGIAACVAIARRFSDHCIIHFDAGFLSQISDCSTFGDFYTQYDWMTFPGSPPAVSGHNPDGPCDWSCYAMDDPLN